jgi:outer membrane protein assembly factor BamE (lipoprotein component of BamABCDE complex)
VDVLEHAHLYLWNADFDGFDKIWDRFNPGMVKAMKNTHILFAMLALISGCASSGNQIIKDQTSETVAQKIQKGISTQKDVKIAFGDPSSTSFTDSGNELWNYVYAKATAKPENFIPVVGLFAAGANVDKKTLVVFFDQNGVVKNFTISSSQEEVRRGLLNN